MKTFLLILLFGTAAQAAPTLVQQLAETRDSGSLTITVDLPSPISVGNTLIVCFSGETPAPPATPIVYLHVGEGGPEIPFSLATERDVSGAYVAIFYLHNVPFDGLIRITATAIDEGRKSANVSEWSGLVNAEPEATGTSTATASDTVTTPSVTPRSEPSLVIAVGGWTADNYSTGPTNSFTRMTQSGGDAAWLESAYQVETDGAARTTGWGLTAGINWASAIAVFGTSKNRGGFAEPF